MAQFGAKAGPQLGSGRFGITAAQPELRNGLDDKVVAVSTVNDSLKGFIEDLSRCGVGAVTSHLCERFEGQCPGDCTFGARFGMVLTGIGQGQWAIYEVSKEGCGFRIGDFSKRMNEDPTSEGMQVGLVGGLQFGVQLSNRTLGVCAQALREGHITAIERGCDHIVGPEVMLGLGLGLGLSRWRRA